MFRIYSSFGEIDTIVHTNIHETILNAWNYEASVYDADDNLIFDGWLDADEQNELLKPYELEVVGINGFRHLKNSKSGVIYMSSWQKSLGEEYDVEWIEGCLIE